MANDIKTMIFNCKEANAQLANAQQTPTYSCCQPTNQAPISQSAPNSHSSNTLPCQPTASSSSITSSWDLGFRKRTTMSRTRPRPSSSQPTAPSSNLIGPPSAPASPAWPSSSCSYSCWPSVIRKTDDQTGGPGVPSCTISSTPSTVDRPRTPHLLQPEEATQASPQPSREPTPGSPCRWQPWRPWSATPGPKAPPQPSSQLARCSRSSRDPSPTPSCTNRR